MREPARVSVVTPFFNLEKFLAETIDGVLAQTYPRWELLLVDDGSTDSSRAIAQRYAERYPERIRYLAHEHRANRGTSASRNLALRHATGEYIAFLDGDDAWLPHKLEEQVAMLDAMPEAGALYGRSLWWYSWTGAMSDRRRDRPQPLGVRPDRLLPPPLLLTRALLDRAAFPCTSSVIVRRRVVEVTGGFEEEFPRLYDDQAFFAKVLLATPIYVAGNCWDLYRQHPQSTMVAEARAGDFHPELPHRGRYIFLQWLERYLVGRGLQGTEVWQALQRQLWLYRHPRLQLALVRLRLLPDHTRRLFWEAGFPLAVRIGQRVLPKAWREWLWARLSRWL